MTFHLADEFWPLAAAVTWILTGDRRRTEFVARNAEDFPLGMYFAATEGAASPYSVVKPWRREAQGETKPFEWALSQVAEVLATSPAPAKGREAQTGSTTDIPRGFWRAGRIREATVKGRRSGLSSLVAISGGQLRWSHIEVPGAPFRRSWRPKAGVKVIGTVGRPASLVDVRAVEIVRGRWNDKTESWAEQPLPSISIDQLAGHLSAEGLAGPDADLRPLAERILSAFKTNAARWPTALPGRRRSSRAGIPNKTRR